MAFKFGPIPYLELEFNQLGNAPVGNPTSVSDWNTFFDLPNYGTPFTKVRIIGNIIRLYGGENITLKSQIFQSRPLKKISDSKIIIKANDNSFYGCTSLTSVSLFGLINAGNYCFYNCTSLTSISLPACINILYDLSFSSCTALTSISLPVCIALGSSVLNNNLFLGITGKTISLTIPASRMTCNGGNPDGDIQYLQANNTVTITTT
mgnify:CR=1 FL=1